MTAIRLNAKSYSEAVKACAQHLKPGLAILQVCHDDGCPAMTTQRDADCDPKVCKPDFYLVRPDEREGAARWN